MFAFFLQIRYLPEMYNSGSTSVSTLLTNKHKDS